MERADKCRISISRARRTICLTCLGLLGAPIYVLNFGFSGFLRKENLIASGIDAFTSFLYQMLPLGTLYLIGTWIAFRYDTPKAKTVSVYVILLFAPLYRVLLAPTQAVLSSDIYRYIWDGRVQAHGINPYRYPPGDKALEDLRDEAIYPNLNRHASPTIYPAGAQVLFYALNGLGIESIQAFKGTVILFDMGSVLVLMMILVSMGLACERALIYAWNPLVIYELGGSGHLDGIMLFFVLLSLLLLIKERPFASVFSLALAVSLKLYPSILLPAVLKDKKIRGSLFFIAMVLLFFLLYLGVGKKVLGFLPEYLGNPGESFNLGLTAYLLKLFPNAGHLVISTVVIAVLLITDAV